MRFIIIFFFLIPLLAFGQQDSVQKIVEVIATETVYIPKSTKSVLTQKSIEELAPTDVGELIKKIAGVNLKSYGSLGGLKTVSMRGLGANHSAIVRDGFSISNTQTGQVNLGQIQVDNVVGLVSSVGKRFSTILPVSAQISGSNFLIKTFENTFSSDTLKIRASMKYGSFNQLHSYIGVKYQPKNYFISMFGSVRESEGDYKFNFQNGLQIVNDIRINNDYKDYSIGGSIGGKWKTSFARLGYRQSSISQGLPGAVILYNSTQDERMETADHSVFGDFQKSWSSLDVRVYGNARINNLNYLDPTFLNTSGEIDVEYTNRSLTGGVTFSSTRLKSFVINGGIEEVSSDLISTDSTFAEPTRHHNYGLLGVKYFKRKLSIQLQVSSQYVVEKNKNGENVEK